MFSSSGRSVFNFAPDVDAEHLISANKLSDIFLRSGVSEPQQFKKKNNEEPAQIKMEFII